MSALRSSMVLSLIADLMSTYDMLQDIENGDNAAMSSK